MARQSPHVWTPSEDDQLREVYRATSRAELSAGLTRLCAAFILPRLSLNRRAEWLGLTRDIRRPWTPEELTYLSLWAARKPGRVIARFLHRSEASVHTKLHDLKLTRQRKGRRTQTEVVALFRVTDDRVRRWAALGWLVTVDGYYTDAALQRFAVTHPEAFDPRTVEIAWLRSVLAALGHSLVELDKYKIRDWDSRRAA